MPRVHQRVARKDYPKYGIEKGQKHYHWVLKTGPRSSREFRQIAPPKQSQLTTSEYLGTLYDIQDSIGAATDGDGIRVCADELETLASETREKYENMPEGLQQGDTGQLLEERADNCDAAATAITEACDEYDSAIEEIDKRLEVWNAYREAHSEDEDEGDPDNAEEPAEEEITEEEAEEARTEAFATLQEAANDATGDC